MTAREGLHRQVDPLVALEVMIAVERLRTLVALEWAVVLLLLLLLLPRMMAVDLRTHLMRLVLHVQATDECHLITGLCTLDMIGPAMAGRLYPPYGR